MIWSPHGQWFGVHMDNDLESTWTMIWGPPGIIWNFFHVVLGGSICWFDCNIVVGLEKEDVFSFYFDIIGHFNWRPHLPQHVNVNNWRRDSINWLLRSQERIRRDIVQDCWNKNHNLVCARHMYKMWALSLAPSSHQFMSQQWPKIQGKRAPIKAHTLNCVLFQQPTRIYY